MNVMSVPGLEETSRWRTSSLFGTCASRMKSSRLPYSQASREVVPLRQVSIALPSSAHWYDWPFSVNPVAYLRQKRLGPVGIFPPQDVSSMAAKAVANEHLRAGNVIPLVYGLG